MMTQTQLGSIAVALLLSGLRLRERSPIHLDTDRSVLHTENHRTVIFAVLDMRPGRRFDEVARIQSEWQPFYTPTAKTTDELKSLIRRGRVRDGRRCDLSER